MTGGATIYIPTRGRIDYQRTWSSISPYWRDRTKLVTVPEETEALYLCGYPVLECPVSGIANTRQWILEQHESDGPVILMDDDRDFFARRNDDPTKMRGLQPGEFDLMMGELVDLLALTPLVGIANRARANFQTEPLLRNTRMHDLLVVDPQVARREGFRFDNVEFMEDFDFILQVLAAGYDTLLLNTYVKGDHGSNRAGGCSTYRTPEGQTAAALDLALRWPEFVKLRSVRRAGDEWWANRTDVTVQWAKAAAHGRLARQDAEGA